MNDKNKTTKHKKNRSCPLKLGTGPARWAKCYLEHAVRETACMAQNAKVCDYAAAHDAAVRREVWLHAALLAQEQISPNIESSKTP